MERYSTRVWIELKGKQMTNKVHQLNFHAIVPSIEMINAHQFAKDTDTTVVACIGCICMIIDKNTDVLQHAKQEYDDKVKFLTEITAIKQARHK